ncbi:MAG: amidohydrolase family protein [Candidatus Heimdallarchaeota archaeon]|nr:amidohydrolase family protein [Candidatus Heimdallarchaeota archaeon]MCK4609606.1 amidohydrolase family protein [Candidatus Heimdallarchaeota archaeon]
MYNLFGESIVAKYTINPAIIHNLFPKKGIIQIGSDAGFVIFDPNKVLYIDSGHSHSDNNPYENMIVTSMVESTILRGEFLVNNRKFVGSSRGQFIKR